MKANDLMASTFDLKKSRLGQSGDERELVLPDVLGAELSAIIERRIIYLEMAPGSHVTEQEICDEFNISRSPVREAFRQLQASGLVVRHARRGIRVTPMTLEHLDEIYFCRTALEAMAAASAAKNATDEDLAFLSDALKEMSRAMANKQSKAFFDYNVAFINRIHTATGNKMLTNILTIIEKQALRYRYFAHMSSKAMLQNSFKGLTAIYDGIRSRRPAQAKKAAASVMRDAHAIIAAALQEYGDLSRWKPPVA
jgi:DNA-binding GntR family transcriptional regulator